jgi:environmental stress-induced protein Ves
MKLVRYSDLSVMPWKNGAGVRRDVVQAKHSIAGVDAGWLISIAQFSSYPDVKRWFLPISAGWVTLMFEDKGTPIPVELTEASPVHEFSGSDTVRCELHKGPMKALNVMTYGSAAKVSVERVRLHSSTWLTLGSTPDGEVGFLIVTDGVCRVKSDVWSGPVAKLNSLVNDSGKSETFEISPLDSTEVVIVKIKLGTQAPHDGGVTG